jgi:hypothetical protein
MSSVPGSAFEPGSFHTWLLSANGLTQQGFKEWVFHPGMLFGSGQEWWGAAGDRAAPHEGLDLCLFKDGSSATRQVRAGTKIPAAFAGTIVNLCDDFLGKSVFIRHDAIANAGRHLFTIFGHTQPVQYLCRSAKVAGGETIATIADAGGRNSGVPSHLHISTAWIFDNVSPAALGWETIGKERGITLVDPLSILELPHSIADFRTFTPSQS